MCLRCNNISAAKLWYSTAKKDAHEIIYQQTGITMDITDVTRKGSSTTITGNVCKWLLSDNATFWSR